MSALKQYHILKIAQSVPDMLLAMAAFIGTSHFGKGEQGKGHWALTVG